eukprot:CAMPEP_0113693274 /NCGR_PEP_ID=MMETSP0038_2-20120614/19570_1 /TAXON_ID=2898 /ORGANISM="Cryptomonas paramecium" /LENGTH=808 /DNA_ID=CAMNT_0000615321 /DNA_START=253 /DNA_END=2676 /DNA_ORIENTATION=- /assembly_acc=CAM_ASM_000170
MSSQSKKRSRSETGGEKHGKKHLTQDEPTELNTLIKHAKANKKQDINNRLHHRIGSRWIEFPRWQLGTLDGKLQLEKTLKQCLSLVKDLSKRKNGFTFAVPVDPISLGLPDYFDIVKDPMDLSTIQRSLEMGFYLQGDHSGKTGLRLFMEELDLIWTNAMLYNPSESPVHAIAQEFKQFADAQLEKIIAGVDAATERDACERNGLNFTRPVQLVMDRYMFLKGNGDFVPPAELLEQGVAVSRLVGVLVPSDPSRDPHTVDPETAWELQPLALHFDLVETGPKQPDPPVVVWVRTERHWVRLLRPAACWPEGAWLDRVWAGLALCRAFGEAPREPFDRLARTACKALADARPTLRGAEGSRHTDGPARQLIVDAWPLAVGMAHGLLRTCPSKFGEKELSKLKQALALEASKLGEPSCGQDAEAGQNPCPLDADKVRETMERELSVVEQLGFMRSAVPQPEPTPGSGGYWERDAEGQRRWVQEERPEAAPTKPAKRKAEQMVSQSECAAVAEPRPSVAEALQAEPLACKVGGRLQVLFDDGVWYAGHVTGFDESSRLWHDFGDDDEDDVGYPDPDVRLLPPMNLALQMLEEATDGVRRGVRELLGQAKMAGPLVETAGEVRKKVTGAYRAARDAVERHAVGRVHAGEASLAELRDSLLERVRAKLAAECGLTNKQWRFVLAHRGEAAAADLPGIPEPSAPAPPQSKVKRKRQPRVQEETETCGATRQSHPTPPDSPAKPHPKPAKSTNKAAAKEPGPDSPSVAAADVAPVVEAPKRSKQKPARPLVAATVSEQGEEVAHEAVDADAACKA